jgi:hypothetical protein
MEIRDQRYVKNEKITTCCSLILTLLFCCPTFCASPSASMFQNMTETAFEQELSDKMRHSRVHGGTGETCFTSALSLFHQVISAIGSLWGRVFLLNEESPWGDVASTDSQFSNFG